MRPDSTDFGGNPAALQTRQSFRRRMTWDRGLSADVVKALWESPNGLLRQGECLQTKSRTTVARVDLTSGSYLLKFHHWAGFWKTLAKSRAVAPNRHSFDLGIQLSDGGVPTPRPLACVDVRLGPLNVCSYLLTEFVVGTSLYRTMRYRQPASAEIDNYAQQVAEIWQQLDDMQLSHNDLKPENFMIDPSGRVSLIDLENAQRHKDTAALRECQAEDAKRLLHVRSWQANPAAAEIFRQRLLATPAVQTAIAEPGGTKHPLAQGAEGASVVSQTLTVLIPCNNATDELSGCVESVRDFADEIVLAIPDGNDRAWDVVENLPDCRGWWCERFDDQTHRAAIATARNPWVLVLEPNERISPDLAKEIQFLLTGNPTSDAYCIERRNYFCGRPVRFGDMAGDMPVRLVRRVGPVLPSVDRLNGRRPPQGIGKLRCRIFRYRARTVEELQSELTQHAGIAAQTMHANGKRASLTHMLIQPPLSFVRSYFVRLGCLDGWAGLQVAAMSAAVEYVEYAKLWQLQHGLSRPEINAAESPRLKSRDSDDQRAAA